MGRETDFLDLYRDLKLQPDCGLSEFRQAYRRRLSLLHPDRPVDGQSGSPEQLQRLTALYAAAMEFHRQHGRLPGAIQARPFQFTQPPRPAVTVPVEEPTKKRPRWWLLVPVAVLATWMLWPAERPPVAQDGDTPADTTDNSQPASASSIGLKLGMSADAVRAIEGEPVIIGDNRWDYGPSWVRFEDHKLAGWYSSPLRPLKIANSPKQP